MRIEKPFIVEIPFNQYIHGRHRFLTNVQYSGRAYFYPNEQEKFDYDIDLVTCEGKEIPQSFLKAMDIEPKESSRIDEHIISYLDYLFRDDMDRTTDLTQDQIAA